MKIKTYTRIAFRDLFRLWRSTQHHVVIVAGICLPLLLLLGIKSGFIEEMRRELLASPQGRQITFWAMNNEQFLLADNLEKLTENVKNIDVLIPEVQRLIQASSPNSGILDITLLPTSENDPLLSFAKVSLPRKGRKEVVLTKSLAKELGVDKGDYVNFHVNRNTDAGRESDQVSEILVTAIYDAGDNSGNVAYCDISLIDDIELYIKGFAAPSLELLAANNQYSPKYLGYLLVSRSILEQDSDLTPLEDMQLRIVKIDPDIDEVKDDIPVTLINSCISNLFITEDAKSLHFYYVDSGSSKNKLGRDPFELASKTRNDDIVIPLYPSVDLTSSSGPPIRLIGLDVGRTAWARNFTSSRGLLFRFPSVINEYRTLSDDSFQSAFLSIAMNKEGDQLTLEKVPDDKLQRFVTPETDIAKFSYSQIVEERDRLDILVANISTEFSHIESAINSLEERLASAKVEIKEEKEDIPPSKVDPPAPLEEGQDLPEEKNAPNQSEVEPSKPQTDSFTDSLESELTSESDEATTLESEIVKLESELEETKAKRDEKASELAKEKKALIAVNELYSKLENERENAPIYQVGVNSNSLEADGAAEPDSELGPITLIVPSRLLGCLNEFSMQNIQFDAAQQIFIETTPELSYGRARVYTNTIDDVPLVVGSLSELGYAVLSEKDRIDEIHATNDSLQLLVVIVGIGVIGFGILTVFSVLSDSTDRKRGTIGVLRVMGVSRFGVFYVVVLRASMIGVAAGLFSILSGIILAALLKSRISIVFEYSHLSTVIVGALFCSAAGALLPAFKASRLDPFDAIQEGKFS